MHDGSETVENLFFCSSTVLVWYDLKRLSLQQCNPRMLTEGLILKSRSRLDFDFTG